MHAWLEFKMICKNPKTRRKTIWFSWILKWRSSLQKKTPRNENFDVWTLQSCRPQKMRGFNFFKFIYRKIAWRSYNYFLKYSHFNYLEKWVLYPCQKPHSFVKSTRSFRRDLLSKLTLIMSFVHGMWGSLWGTPGMLAQQCPMQMTRLVQCCSMSACPNEFQLWA